jgi:hypothetical protein
LIAEETAWKAVFDTVQAFTPIEAEQCGNEISVNIPGIIDKPYSHRCNLVKGHEGNHAEVHDNGGWWRQWKRERS